MPELLSAEEILQKLQENKRRYDFPRAQEREFWDNLAPAKRKELISQAEIEQQNEFPCLKAKDFMKFIRNGNRIDYETPYFRKRAMLSALVLGECAEYQGRFIDDVIEGIWQILSEPVWSLPAHQALGDFPLPEPEQWVVGLFSAETAKMLTDIIQLLGPELEKICPPLVNRIRYEVEHRVLSICEQRTYWWYEGTNNWSVWCCFSINAAAIEIFQDDLPRLAAFLAKHMVPLKNFFDRYPDDGGCDEGTVYWTVAVGMLLNNLDILQRRLGGFEDWLNAPKLRKMVEFVPNMNLCGKWFMSYSDAEPCFYRLPRGIFAKYGRMIGCQEMVDMAMNLPESELADADLGNRNGLLTDELAELIIGEIIPGKFEHNAIDFWPNLQIWIARQMPETPEKGMVVTLKGGHNSQSHNHLDLGHFSLFHRNAPIIVDVGRGVYNKTCFSVNRYTLWNLNSDGHNAPLFDGIHQGLGAEYASLMEAQDNKVICDITAAYKQENGIKSCVRQVATCWEKGFVEVEDKAEFSGSKEITIALYTPVKPEIISPCALQLQSIRFDFEQIDLDKIVKLDCDDAKIKRVWGDLWQINFKCTKEDSANWKFRFSEI